MAATSHRRGMVTWAHLYVKRKARREAAVGAWDMPGDPAVPSAPTKGIKKGLSSQDPKSSQCWFAIPFTNAHANAANYREPVPFRRVKVILF